jgi:hypothetical protein
MLLVLLGVIHLVATPYYLAWSRSALLPSRSTLVIAGLRLNHILVGILLIPLGLSGYWAGQALPERWAIRLATTNAMTVFCLPVLLVLTMPLRSLDAPLFRLAIAVLLVACLAQLGAVAAVWSKLKKDRTVTPTSS